MSDKYVDFSQVPCDEKEISYRVLLCEAERLIDYALELLEGNNTLEVKFESWKEAKDNV